MTATRVSWARCTDT